MQWDIIEQKIHVFADIASILTFLGLGIIGLRIGSVMRRFGPRQLLMQLKKLFALD